MQDEIMFQWHILYIHTFRKQYKLIPFFNMSEEINQLAQLVCQYFTMLHLS